MTGHSKDLCVPKGFLRRKFVAPQPPNPCVLDVDNTERICDLDSWRLCLMSAAYGYGKTSLLAQWYAIFDAREDCHPVWITLDAHDTQITRMVVSLAVAFQQVSPKFLELATDLLAREDVEGMVTDLVNLMDEECDPDVNYIIILDDIDESDSPQTDIWMPYLFKFTGDNIKCIMAGNFIPKTIEDLLLDSSVMEIRTEDLAFDKTRMREFAFKLIDDLTEEEFETTCDLAAGWPTAYVFYRLTRGRKGAASNPTKLFEGFYARYFEKHVMEKLDSVEYEFLVETSLLDHLRPDLCDAVTGTRFSKAIIERLYDKNAYVLFDRDAGLFHYMPLFRKFLISKLLALQNSQINKLARTATEWCIENGFMGEMYKYLVITSDPFYLEAVVMGSTGLSKPDPDLPLVEYFLNEPASNFMSDPYLCASVAWAAIAAGFVDIARATIEAMCNMPADSYPVDDFRYSDALCYALEGDSAKSLQLIETVLSSDDIKPSHAFECLLVHMAGENHERLGDVKGARALYQKAMSSAERENSTFYKMFDQYLLARQYVDLGRLDDAVSLAKRAMADCPRSSAVYGEFNTIIAYAKIQRHELDEAAVFLQRAQRIVSSEANIDIYVDTQVASARLAQSRGDTIGALEIMSELVKRIAGKTIPRNMAIEAYSTQAVLAVALGERSIVNSCEYILDSFKGNPDLLRAIPCMLAKAHILRMRGQREECLELTALCRKKATECASPYFLTQIAVFLAGFYAEEGKETQASIEITRAIEISILEGYRAVFLRGGAQIKDLLVKQATNRKSPPSVRRYAKELLEAFSDEDDVANELAMARGDAFGFYSLTEREHETLRLLNSGMSRGEIAERLHVSENTVKSHLKNIYAKLGVHTRSEAYKATLEYTSQA